MTPSEKLRSAQKATIAMDGIIDPAVQKLRAVVRDGNGAGVYFDHSAVHAALVDMRDAANRALEIYRAAQWPTAYEYDRM